MPELFFAAIGMYILMNIVLFILEKYTNKIKIMHRIFSAIDNVIFIFIVGYGFYHLNHLFVFFVPIILLFVYPLSWGINEELSPDEAVALVRLTTVIPLKRKTRTNIKLLFIRFATFPFYYLLKSWKKK